MAEDEAIGPTMASSRDSSSGGQKGHSYGEILKSSVLIGGSSVLTVLIRVVRTKALAIILGPAGIGLMGLLASIEDLAASIAGMGLRMSGVRQIADAVGKGDQSRVAMIATVLSRSAWWLGLAGAIGLLVFSQAISDLTFNTYSYAFPVALLGLSVFFRVIADGQGAVIHGLRRITDLAKLGPIGGLIGAVVGVGIVSVWHTDGIAPAAVASALGALAVSWWYRRKVPLDPVELTGAQIRHEAVSLLRLGFAFMASGLFVLGSTYAMRIIVLRDSGLHAAGLYQAAMALGSIYVTIVLQAMSTDFYPRLVNVSSDNSRCNQLMNEQAHVSTLLAGPGILATLTLAAVLVPIFYSAQFAGAVSILKWICLGMALRVWSWPMGMVMLAKNTQRFFFLSELAWNAAGVVLTWLLVARAGLDGAGYAFFATQVFHVLMTYGIARWLTDFNWSSANRRVGLLLGGSFATVMIAAETLSFGWGIVVGMGTTIAVSIYCLRELLELVGARYVPPAIQVRLVRCGLMKRVA